MTEPGVYKTVDSGGLKKLQTEHEHQIDESNSKAKIWAKHKEEYKILQNKLSTITDKTHYNVMVPFGGKKAFFEGQLVHTNEVMVLLGDNWFVERSAKEASEICQRRLDRCDEMLENLNKEVKLYKSWLHEAKQLGKDQENLLEIREPYNEDEESKWRIQHRDRVKNERLLASKAATSDDKSTTNEDSFWKRLDELELEEELEAHLEAQEANKKDNDQVLEDESGDEEDDWSNSPPLSSSSSSEEEVEEISNDKIVTTGPRRSVSFGDVSERLFSREQDNGLLKDTIIEDSINTNISAPDTKIIEFQPSKMKMNFSSNVGDKTIPNSPGELVGLYGAKQTTSVVPARKKAPKKSILKAGSKYGPLIKTEPVGSTPKVTLEPKIQAVSDVVIERGTGSNNSGESSKTPVTQVLSRFRATRVHQ